MRTSRRAVLAFALGVLVGGSAFGLLRWQSSPEEVKAAFLYQFTRFIEWPSAAFAKPSDPWRVAVLGDDPLYEALEKSLRDKRVDQRPFRIERVEAAGDLRGFHVVFVPEDRARRLPEILSALRGSPCLVVGASPGFAAEGGAVNFVLENRRIRFEINPAAADAAGLKVSSKLLQLARVVKSP